MQAPPSPADRAAEAEQSTDIAGPPIAIERGRDDHLNVVAGVLLEAFRDDDDIEAFGLLVELTQPRLLELARGLLHRQSALIDADDLVARFLSGLFTDVRKHPPRVRQFLALAYTVMRYDILNQVRLHQRATRRHEIWEQRRHVEGRPIDPADLLDRRERTIAGHRAAVVFLAVVSSAFLGLPDRDRRVLHLRELEGQSYDDLALSLDVPRTQVGMVLKRARERLAAGVQRRLAEVPPVGRNETIGGSPLPDRPAATADSSRPRRQPNTVPPRRRATP